MGKIIHFARGLELPLDFGFGNYIRRLMNCNLVEQCNGAYRATLWAFDAPRRTA